MDAVILCAGRGERMRPLTDAIPKPLLPYRGKPIVEYIIDDLVQHGCKRIFLVVGYLKEQFFAYADALRRRGMDIRCIVQEPQRGTAHAVSLLPDDISSLFLLAVGDSVFERVPYQELLRSPVPAILISHQGNSARQGIVLLEDTRVKDIKYAMRDEGPAYTDVGILVLPRKSLEIARAQHYEKELYLPDVIKEMLGETIFRAVIYKGTVRHFTSSTDLNA